MVCITSSNSMKVNTFIRKSGSGNKVLPSDGIKILGFHFSNRPSVDKHIEETLLKGKKRLWLLINLKRAHASTGDLLDCYT